MSSLSESRMCRLCAWEHVENKNIYEMEISLAVDKSVVIVVKMVELIEKNLNLKLSVDDKLPGRICLDCQQAVQALSQFLVKIRQGQAYLRKLLEQQITVETISSPSCENISCSLKETSPLSSSRKRGRPRKGLLAGTVASGGPKPEETNEENYPEENKLNIDESLQQNIKLEVARNTESRKQFSCVTCNLQFNKSDDLTQHMDSFHQVFACDKTDLKAEHDFQCGFCVQTFINKDSYTSHTRLAHSTKMYSCDVCERVFNAESSLRYHKQANHQGEEFPCSVSGCNKVFKIKTQLNRHLKFHANDRPHSCNQCDKTFKCLSNLKQHEKTHSDLKIYQCEVCGQEFKHKSSLNIHKQIHNQLKKFECPTCNKKFHQSGNLKEHMRSHTGEKRFSCNICEKAFVTSSQLKKHKQRIHEALSKEVNATDSSTKPSNQIIPQALPFISLLTRSQPRVFSCVYCEKMFPVKKSLNAHIKSEHYDLSKQQKDPATDDTDPIHNKDHNFSDKITLTSNDKIEENLRRQKSISLKRKMKISQHSKLNSDEAEDLSGKPVNQKQLNHNKNLEKDAVIDIQGVEESIVDLQCAEEIVDDTQDVRNGLDNIDGFREGIDDLQEVKKDLDDLQGDEKDGICEAGGGRTQVWNILKSAVDQNPQTEGAEEDNQVIYITYENDRVDSTPSNNANISTSQKKVGSGDDYPLAEYLKDLHNIPVTHSN